MSLDVLHCFSCSDDRRQPTAYDNVFQLGKYTEEFPSDFLSLLLTVSSILCSESIFSSVEYWSEDISILLEKITFEAEIHVPDGLVFNEFGNEPFPSMNMVRGAYFIRRFWTLSWYLCLFYCPQVKWEPVSKKSTKGVIIIGYGAREHWMSYMEYATCMALKGIAVDF